MLDGHRTAAHSESRWQSFVHQELPGFTPIYRPWPVSLAYLCLSFVLLGLGAGTLATELTTENVRVRYDNAGPMAGLSRPEQERLVSSKELISTPLPRCFHCCSRLIPRPWPQIRSGAGGTFNLSVPITKTLRAPIYVYVQLGSFFQNNRRRVEVPRMAS